MSDSGKVSQDEAKYRVMEKIPQACITCSMFRIGGSCSKVAGDIKSFYVCDFWQNLFTGKP